MGNEFKSVKSARALANKAVEAVKMIGPLAELPGHVQEVVKAYAALVARSALLHVASSPVEFDDAHRAGGLSEDIEALAKPKAAQCRWPDCGHDTNGVGYSSGCTGKFCKQQAEQDGSGAQRANDRLSAAFRSTAASGTAQAEQQGAGAVRHVATLRELLANDFAEQDEGGARFTAERSALEAAICAIAARQSVGEPFAWGLVHGSEKRLSFERHKCDDGTEFDGDFQFPLYTAPPAPAAVPVDELKEAVSVLLELPQLHGKQAQWAQPVITRVRAALAANPPPAAPQGVDLGRIETALREACEYVGQRSDGDLVSLAERCELWMRESRVLIDSLKRQGAAVDLGQFRDLAEFALRNAKFHNCWERREALARELLALIDSKAVRS